MTIIMTALALLKVFAMAYVANTPGEALAIARELNWVEYPSVDNMCGPLAAHILSHVGLVHIDPNEFWKLNPDVDEWKLNKAFPNAEWFWVESLSEMALQPADFIYAFGAPYEHMMAVTDIDVGYGAMTVTNLKVGDDWLIQHVAIAGFVEQQGLGSQGFLVIRPATKVTYVSWFSDLD